MNREMESTSQFNLFCTAKPYFYSLKKGANLHLYSEKCSELGLNLMRQSHQASH